jgi:hypothetical protein
MTMSPGLAILDTWLMMLTSTALLWLGAVSLYSKGGGAEAGVALLGGVTGCALVAVLGRGGKALQRTALALRLAIVCCFAYFAWFQQRPWFPLDDSALVRGSFRQEFILQRLEQLGVFLLFMVPFIVLGIWRGKAQPRIDAPPTGSRANSAVLLGLVGVALAVVLTARLVGPPRLGLASWTLGGIMISALLVELARRVNRAEFPAFVAFAAVVLMTPVLLLWP